MRTNLARKIVRGVTIPLVVIGVGLTGITAASARPDPHEFDEEYYGPQPHANTEDSFWTDVMDFLAGSGWDR
jgi:hypothetical protein